MPVLPAARAALLSLSATLAVACGGGSKDPEQALTEGYNALARGDGKTALPLLESAAANLARDPSDPRWKEIQLAVVEAQARIDGERGKERFLELARANTTRFEAADFASVGGKLFQVGASASAIAVVDAGIKEFQHDDPRLRRVLADIEKKARAEGDAETIGALRSLGYLGGSDDDFDDDDQDDTQP